MSGISVRLPQVSALSEQVVEVLTASTAAISAAALFLAFAIAF
jgi:hypothetical protein